MEETLVTSFLDRLNYLLIQESEIVYGLEDQILLFKTKLSDLKSQIQLFTQKLFEIGYFLSEEEDATTTTTTTNISTELTKSIQNWLGRFRDTIYDADDCTDQFIIRMNSEDREVAGVVFQSELQMINECLVEILHGKSQLDQSIASIEHRGEVNMQQSSSFALKFNSLPFYLKSCLMYCHILAQKYKWIWKDELIRLLMAEGLIQEIPGERMEDTAEENINKIIELGMLQVEDEEYVVSPVPIQYLNFVAGDETMFITTSNSETAIPLNFRRLLIKDIGNTNELNLNNIHLRSIIISNMDCSIYHLNFLETMFHHLKLLRVLDLKFVKLKSLPEKVGNLIHLRYLGLRYCDHLKELPDSLCSLGNLQTLDITYSDEINVLPSRIMNLQQLRHLLMGPFDSVLIRTGLGRLTNLQTLTGLYAGGSIASELSNLTQIRKLGVCYLSELEDEIELYASIMKMTGLLSLTLSAEDTCYYTGSSLNEELLPSFEHFSPPPCLRNLHLFGCLQEMPDWLSSMENLTELELYHSDLPEIPTYILQFLPNLKHLVLHEAFTAKHMGREFFRSGGFPSLEVLIIRSQSLIEWIEVEEGALPSLKCLKFYDCPRLRTLPEGLQLITTLKELCVDPMHGDLARKLSPNGGRENYKIKHIPVTILYPPFGI